MVKHFSEKLLVFSNVWQADVIGIVIKIFTSLTVPENADCNLSKRTFSQSIS